jgi:hypothetical protein
MASLVSVLSLYIYQLPTHHCPFDMIQKQYSFIGYPIYVSLFSAVYFGLLPGLVLPLRRIPSLTRLIAENEMKWLILGIISMSTFAVVASWMMVFGELTLSSY